jgi:hypothetical protein
VSSERILVGSIVPPRNTIVVILAGGLASDFTMGPIYFHGAWHCPGLLPLLPSPIATLLGDHIVKVTQSFGKHETSYL